MTAARGHDDRAGRGPFRRLVAISDMSFTVAEARSSA